MATLTVKIRLPADWASDMAGRGLRAGLRPLQALLSAPSTLFLLALTAMLLRHPDVAFYEIDRVAFVLLVLGVAGRAVLLRQPLLVMERASWPMLGLAILAVGSVIGRDCDSQVWSPLAAKFIVPFALFHLAKTVFNDETSVRQFEVFALVVLAYLCFVSIAFLADAKGLIFPPFILNPSLGYHADRARGPLLQAVANGVSLNLLGILAVHAYLRGRVRGLKAGVLLASVPLAVLATMTRAVWLSFAGSLVVLMLRTHDRGLQRICARVAIGAVVGLLVCVSLDAPRRALAERLEESGPVEFRKAVYTGGWEMFLEKPLIGWGVNQMPTELARHVSGYKQKELFPHNTYLELLVEHGIAGLALYLWLMWELLRLGRVTIPATGSDGLLNRQFHAIWPILLGVYWVNAAVVVMNYQFVNGLLFTMAGMLAAQKRRALREVPAPQAAFGASPA